jgi:glycosidase
MPVQNPKIYQINTRVWLRKLSKVYQKEISLENIPAHEWLKIKNYGFDYIWLMGVWKIGLNSIVAPQAHEPLAEEFARNLPDWKNQDVIGSPYAIKDYSINLELGGEGTLEFAKKVINHYGLGVILDFVPNHTASDHHWVFDHPQFYIQAVGDESEEELKMFFKIKDKYIAHGKDPNFPPWLDTAQLNYFDTDSRQAIKNTIYDISKVCDGIRCDVAMMILNDIYNKTWTKQKNNSNNPEFWLEAIKTVKTDFHDFIFISESYWDTGEYLQELGFDFTYDKDLYDLILEKSPQDVNNYIKNQKSPDRWFRYIENHDEERAVSHFGLEKSQAAAVLTSTLPGASMIHQGQMVGKTRRIPVQLRRGFDEPNNLALEEFYKKLLTLSQSPVFKTGKWQMLEVKGWDDNQSCQNLIAYFWDNQTEKRLIILNLSDQISDGQIQMPELDNQVEYQFVSQFEDETFSITQAKLNQEGFYVRLKSFGFCVFKIE